LNWLTDMDDANYRIKYKKRDVEIEVQGDKAWVEKKFKELTERKMAIPEAITPEESSTHSTKALAEELPASLVELIKSKGNPSGHTDLALIFSYWLHHKEKMNSYNKIDIENCYSEARITKPTNATDIMNKNQKKGYLMLPTEKLKDGKKAWVITQTGEEYIEQMKG
jgi:hypothetical protein